MKKQSNVRFEYLYRDAANFKNWGEIIFRSVSDIAIEELSKRVREALIDETYFVAKKARVPDLHFKEYKIDLDHGWHEYYAVSETPQNFNDPYRRPFETFICDLARAKD